MYLRNVGTQEAEPSPYSTLLKTLGLRFEREHLASFASCLDLSGTPREKREQLTQEAVKRQEPAIYQASMTATVRFGSTEVIVVGDPDFILCQDGSYIIRDVKLARRINENDHPEILRQVELYGWLFEQTFGIPPARLEVLTSKKELVPIEYDGGKLALIEIERQIGIRALTASPYSPVGWSKCSPCGYKDHCWKQAEERRDVALVCGVDQSLARALRTQGVISFDNLIAQFTDETLADFKRPRGEKMQRVGKSAGTILKMASALATGKDIHLGPAEIPQSDNFVIFDLEGLPPHMDELQKIYLWGTQVYGTKPGEFKAATAEFGKDGDRIGWAMFLENADAIFGKYGEIPFIHWHHYEKTNVEMYIDRYGDSGGIAERVIDNMVDILPLVKQSIALPLPSYSLKIVEKHIGFKRTQDEYGGDWSIAKYIEATETEDKDLRDKTMESILTYNREDLAATWAVFEWFRKKIQE